MPEHSLHSPAPQTIRLPAANSFIINIGLQRRKASRTVKGAPGAWADFYRLEG